MLFMFLKAFARYYNDSKRDADKAKEHRLGLVVASEEVQAARQGQLQRYQGHDVLERERAAIHEVSIKQVVAVRAGHSACRNMYVLVTVRRNKIRI